jgi:hypothetical protein
MAIPWSGWRIEHAKTPAFAKIKDSEIASQWIWVEDNLDRPAPFPGPLTTAP